MKTINQAVDSFKESIFATMSKMAAKEQAINLSQGFPDFDGPEFAVEAIQEIMRQRGRVHQYAPFQGVPELRESISWLYKNFYDMDICPDSEVSIVNGATEGIFSSLLAILNPGDEVIIFEPFYDSYRATIELAGAVAVPVTLHAPDFQWISEELEKAFSEKTKLVILNNPHNPTGRVFTFDELHELSQLIIKHDCYAFSDEVYEFLTFDNHNHEPLASLPGMRERTLTTSSLGKTFGFTGWKIGWVVAPQKLTHAVRMVHQFNTFSVNHPMQLAAAATIRRLGDYAPQFQKLYQNKRNYFVEGLQKLDFEPFVPQGTYFVMCPVPDGHQDVEYCQELIMRKKVASIPPSAFYMKSRDGHNYLRFCFAKEDATLKAALDNLANL